MKSAGSCVIPIPTDLKLLVIDVEAVDIDVPFLLGLDAMDRHRLHVLSVSNKLEHVGVYPEDGWRTPVKRKGGHVYLDFIPATMQVQEYFNEVLYSPAQLHKLHRHLQYPSSVRLYNLLKRVNPENLPPETKQVLDEISRSFHPCQNFSNAPQSFSICFPNK